MIRIHDFCRYRLGCERKREILNSQIVRAARVTKEYGFVSQIIRTVTIRQLSKKLLRSAGQIP